ncbi:MAG: TraM recognition domain-containing protein, partial [Accumulibacter sp.]|uniref:type IV secretory system conjugative DNA transfer family protein n=1 Tax=Accumulibacter sp. TaxID=2053492 RepID=UPI0033146DDA
GQEIWFTNNDIRTHLLYVGTTGSGKTEGLKALVTNALSWGSGYVYVDGKADTDLWASLYAVARRFGRDDDVLIINYMTGNSDDGALSNTMNPFSTGSSSYLANMITNFMPEAGGDNAMWKERAVALMFALLPALTYKRDHQGLLMDIGVVRDHIELQPIIRLSRDPTLPERIIHALQGYLRTLPGFVDAAFDDEGNERPPSPDQPMYDLQIARQQHNYLSMQFTRSLQMLADEYSYIFKAQLADIEVLDVVLNRRILVTLIPALEKSGDEAANLGKIVAATLKGMMGSTLGNTVEGSWENSIGSKQTYSSSPFMTVFDEVGYYTARGMAVMAAQARSLGFSLVFATQDLPSMEKSIKQEAKSIVGNCNIKIFGRIEDPT